MKDALKVIGVIGIGLVIVFLALVAFLACILSIVKVLGVQL